VGCIIAGIARRSLRRYADHLRLQWVWGQFMFRVVLAAATAVIVVGCASTADREATASATATGSVQAAQVQKCTTTINVSDSCREPKNCPAIRTCAEANYRLTVCGHRWLDGVPTRNGIPCEAICGRDHKTMADRIAARPFSPPSQTKTDCNPPAKV
jgi:hypothetical protein